MPTYTVADHLMDRLAELGVDRLFGVPGDYSLGLLDHVVAHPVVTWTGTCRSTTRWGTASSGTSRRCTPTSPAPAPR